MRERLMNRYRQLSPDAALALWLVVWWAVNIVTAACTELADDEAYYHIFADALDWGYFDHPPVTALLVRMGEMLCGGELGVRFFFTLLQPLYIYVFWRTVKPCDADRRDAELFAVISASMLVLQLYGFIAVPDGPLLFSAAVFLSAFRRFSEDRPLAWLWLGLATGFMGYCKYHGALVLAFALIPNIGFFVRRPRRAVHLALALAVAAVVLVPHLLWQSDRGWLSFVYHISGRNGVFKVSNLAEFLLNMAAIFSPFFLPLWVQAYRKVIPATPVERALRFLPPAFVVFFAATAVRGYVQPQWAIAAVFGLVWMLFAYARRHPRTRKYVVAAGMVTVILSLLARVEMMCNPLGIKFQIFDNRASYGQIAEAAAGRPVIFNCGYVRASKYRFYADTDMAYSQPNADMHDELHPKANYRSSQWSLRSDDRRFIGREVLVEVDRFRVGESRQSVVEMKNGQKFRYIIVEDYRPSREVTVDFGDFVMPPQVTAGERFDVVLKISNPYPYDICVDGERYVSEVVWTHRTPSDWSSRVITEKFVVPAGGTAEVAGWFEVPEHMPRQEYTAGFAVRPVDLCTWFGSRTFKTTVTD